MAILGPLDPVLTQALSSPSGPDDSGWHTGIIRNWDESSGVNVVEVNGIALTNLKSTQSGIGVRYDVGDNVLILRKQTQYVVMGKITIPGAGLPDQIRYGEVSTQQATGSTTFVDLATVGPVMNNVIIGSSRRFLLIVNASIQCSGTASNQFIGGEMTVNITGASTIPVVGTARASWIAQTTPITGGLVSVCRTFVMTSGNGVNPGSHTFTAQYRSFLASPTCAFGDRAITVIPF